MCISSNSPIKTWPVTQDESGKVQIAPSPNSKKLSNVIYRIQKNDGRAYVGSVADSNTFAKRFSNYKSQINGNPQSREQHIVRAVRRSPKKFSLSLLKKLPKGTSEETLHKVENAYQEKYSTRKTGYNHSDPRLEPLRTKQSFKRKVDEDEDFFPSKQERKRVKRALLTSLSATQS